MPGFLVGIVKDKNKCLSTGELCYNRGCGMFHERCVFKTNNMENKKAIEEIRAFKKDHEEKINIILESLITHTGMFPTYINIVDGKVIITLSLE